MPKSTLTLLVYPTERIKLMQAGVGPNAKGKLDPSLQPFWQVHAYVIYSLERDLSPAQAEVAKHLRSNWTFP